MTHVTIPRELLERALPYLSNTPDLVQYGAEELAVELRAILAQSEQASDVPVVAWANREQLQLCEASPRHHEPDNPMTHNLPRNVAGSALPSEYCNTAMMRQTDHLAAMASKDAEIERLRKEAGAEMFLALAGEITQIRQQLAEREALLISIGKRGLSPLLTEAELEQIDALSATTPEQGDV